MFWLLRLLVTQAEETEINSVVELTLNVQDAEVGTQVKETQNKSVVELELKVVAAEVHVAAKSGLIRSKTV